jgi:hypothetical protein
MVKFQPSKLAMRVRFPLPAHSLTTTLINVVNPSPAICNWWMRGYKMTSSRLIDRIFGKWSIVPSPASCTSFPRANSGICQDYFLKVQSDSTVPPNELIMAAERLTLIRSEIDGRHGDAKYRRAQRLAWWAIALAMVSLTGAIAFAVAQFLTKPPTRESWPADLGTSTVTAAMAMKMATPTPEPTRPPSPTPEVTLAPVYAIAASTSTPTATATRRPRTKHRTRRQSMRKADSRRPVGEFFRSLFPPRPTQTPSLRRRR